MDLLNYNKKVSHVWIDQMIDSLCLLNREIPREKIEKFVKEKYKIFYKPTKMEVRNIYKNFKGWEDPDNTLIYVFGEKRKLLGVNGTLIDNHEENLAPVVPLINILKVKRSKHKKLMLKAKGDGRERDFTINEMFSNNFKKLNNGIYGSQAMEGSLLANVDSAQLITAQARNETTEMAWTVEKLLNYNMCFESFDECFLYLKATVTLDVETIENIEKYRDYIEYYPTIQDLEERYQELIETAEDPNNMHEEEISKFLRNLNDDEKLMFYYKNNLIKFLDKNPKIMDTVRKVVSYQSDIDLNEIDKLPRQDPIFKTLFLSTEDIPEPYNEWTQEFINVLNVFVTNIIPTHNRVEKYATKNRKAIILTDTDSKVFTVQNVINYFREVFGKEGIKIDGEYFDLKCTMFIGAYVMQVVRKACGIFARSLNVPEEYVPRIDFKNEFYFPVLAQFPKVKKNYVAYNLVQEGVLIPKKSRISYTGAKSVSGELNPIISNRIKSEIIEKFIIENPYNIDLAGLYKKVVTMRNEIKNSIIIDKEKIYGKLIKFKGVDRYGVNLAGQSKPRAIVIWNRIYPDMQIGIGDTAYYFTTKVINSKDAIKYIKDPKILNIVMEEVFNSKGKYSIKEGTDFSRFGMEYICVPRVGLPEKLPDWLVDILDIDRLLDDTFKQITDLLPGLNFNLSKVNANRKILSPLIDF